MRVVYMIWISESTFHASRSTVRSIWALWPSFKSLRDHHAVDLSALDFNMVENRSGLRSIEAILTILSCATVSYVSEHLHQSPQFYDLK